MKDQPLSKDEGFLFCNDDETKSGLAREIGNRLQSRNVPFGTSGDCIFRKNFSKILTFKITTAILQIEQKDTPEISPGWFYIKEVICKKK